MVDVAPLGGGLAGGEDTGSVAGAHQVGQTGRGTVPGASHVDHDSACRVGDQAPPGPASCQGPGSQCRHRHTARPNAHLRDLSRRGGRLGDESSGQRRGRRGVVSSRAREGGSSRGGSRQTPPTGAGQTPPISGGQASPVMRGCCTVERIRRGGGALAGASVSWIVAAGGAVVGWSQTNQAVQGDGDLDVDVDVLGEGEVPGA